LLLSCTSCLIALTKIDKLDLLKNLYQEIIITQDVYGEFGGSPPEWILFFEAKNKQKQQELENRLDKREASSIPDGAPKQVLVLFFHVIAI
jgi:predicted nucleic acid-binding protein